MSIDGSGTFYIHGPAGSRVGVEDNADVEGCYNLFYEEPGEGDSWERKAEISCLALAEVQSLAIAAELIGNWQNIAPSNTAEVLLTFRPREKRE